MSINNHKTLGKTSISQDKRGYQRTRVPISLTKSGLKENDELEWIDTKEKDTIKLKIVSK